MNKILLTPILMLLISLQAISQTLDGELVSIGGRDNLVWIRGEFCGSRSMCEGLIYTNATIRQADGTSVLIPRLVLLHPETTDCENQDMYWGALAVEELFSPEKKGKILEFSYQKISHSTLKVKKIDLGIATDAAMGFAARGEAHLGKLDVKIEFPEQNPFPENQILKNFCAGGEGTKPITDKVLHFGEGAF